MMRCASLATFTLLLAAASSGCCCMDRYYYGDCHRPMLWGRHGGAGCGDCQDGTCAGGGCAGGSCADGACGPGGCAAGDCSGGYCNPCRVRPLKALWGLISCTSGCGEFYYDEWLSDPPYCCDPCDDCGHFVGGRPCPKRNWWLGGRGGCGYRSAACCDTSCGYGGCAEGCSSCTQGEAHGEALEEVPTPMPEAVEPTPTQARRPAKPYYSGPATKRVSYNEPRQKTYSSATRSTRFAAPTSQDAPIGTGVPRPAVR